MFPQNQDTPSPAPGMVYNLGLLNQIKSPSPQLPAPGSSQTVHLSHASRRGKSDSSEGRGPGIAARTSREGPCLPLVPITSLSSVPTDAAPLLPMGARGPGLGLTARPGRPRPIQEEGHRKPMDLTSNPCFQPTFTSHFGSHLTLKIISQ